MIRKEKPADPVDAACQRAAVGRAGSKKLSPVNTLKVSCAESLSPATSNEPGTKGQLYVLALGMFVAAIGFVLVAVSWIFPGSFTDLVGVAFLGAGAVAGFFTAPNRSLGLGSGASDRGD